AYEMIWCLEFRRVLFRSLFLRFFSLVKSRKNKLCFTDLRENRKFAQCQNRRPNTFAHPAAISRRAGLANARNAAHGIHSSKKLRSEERRVGRVGGSRTWR